MFVDGSSIYYERAAILTIAVSSCVCNMKGDRYFLHLSEVSGELLVEKWSPEGVDVFWIPKSSQDVSNWALFLTSWRYVEKYSSQGREEWTTVRLSTTGILVCLDA